MSTLSHYGKGALRVAKNYTKGYSHTQAKVRDATSNDPWPPSGRQMHEIAQLTYNQDDFVEIMEILDKRLNDKGKNWRHVFKCLTLIDYLLHAGSENVILYFKQNLYIIKTLREFQYIDDEGKDEGANVRQKAKGIVALLQDEARLRHERRTRAQMYERMARARRSGDSDVTDDENDRRRSRLLASRPSPTREDEDLQRALEESKREAEKQRRTAEDLDLQRALQLSKEDAESRKKSLDDANLILLDDQGQQIPQPSAPLVDATLPLQYFATGIQPQYTAMPMQPQFTSFNPFQQHTQQELLAAQYAQQQAEWLAMQQAQEMQVMQQAQLQAQQEEWMRQQAALQAQAQELLVPQPTSMRIGSNNPFASASQSQSAPPSRQTFSSSPPASGPVAFNLTGTYANRESSFLRSPPARERRAASEAGTSGAGPVRTAADEQHARLASLFASRGEDGVDTFGNVGNLRLAATEAGRVVAQKTGYSNNNPFMQQRPEAQQNGHVREGSLIDL